ncbi:MAG: PglZ domain-containing protein [Saprospiraceae bacterium]|nr:PglZ domain-containing protein [Saprospiraceae bacterium]
MTIDLKKLFASDNEIDTATYNALLKAIKEKHQDGFDYLRFKQSVKSMQNMDMDEDTSFKSAFVTASTVGLTKKKLLSSTKFYMNILNKERESFAEAMRNQLTSKVEAKKVEAEKLAAKIEDYKKKISKMQEEMELYQNKIDSVDGEMESARKKIEATRDKFETTYHSIKEIMENDATKIEGIL